MKLCPTCGEGISMFGNMALSCSLCETRFCSGCEKTYRKQARAPDDHVLCKGCFDTFDDDEVIGIEISCRECHKEYFRKNQGIFACRCGTWFGKKDGSPAKRIVLSCPNCEHELDPFEDRLLSCVLCGDMFCSQCETSFRLASRGDGLFPLCETCHSSLCEGETVQLEVVCENCNDSFTFYDPSKIPTLHGERMRQSDPFPVRCKCGAFHDIDEGTATRVSVVIGWDEEIVIREYDGNSGRGAGENGGDRAEKHSRNGAGRHGLDIVKEGILMPEGWMSADGTVLPDPDSADDEMLMPEEEEGEKGSKENEGRSNDELVENTTCGNCGSPVSENAKFCNQCGMRVGSSSGGSDTMESDEELIPYDDNDTDDDTDDDSDNDTDNDGEELEEIVDEGEDLEIIADDLENTCECGNCHSLIQEDASICPVCGVRFED